MSFSYFMDMMKNVYAVSVGYYADCVLIEVPSPGLVALDVCSQDHDLYSPDRVLYSSG